MTNLRVIEAEPPCEGVVERLEEALEAAQRGEISSLAIAIVYRDGTCGKSWSPAPSLSALIGAIERMKHNIIHYSED